MDTGGDDFNVRHNEGSRSASSPTAERYGGRDDNHDGGDKDAEYQETFKYAEFTASMNYTSCLEIRDGKY